MIKSKVKNLSIIIPLNFEEQKWRGGIAWLRPISLWLWSIQEGTLEVGQALSNIDSLTVLEFFFFFWVRQFIEFGSSHVINLAVGPPNNFLIPRCNLRDLYRISSTFTSSRRWWFHHWLLNLIIFLIKRLIQWWG